MDYHLHSGKEVLGVFPLEELRRRRLDGRLTGNEMVWRQGMPNWRPLDEALGISPNSAPNRKTSPWLIVGIAAGVFCLIIGLVVSFFVARRFVQGLRAAKIQHSQGAASPWLANENGVEAASRPIQQTTKTLRQADVQKMNKAFRVRQYLDAYQQFGAHDQPWDADARFFIQSWIDSNFGGDDATNLPYVPALGDKLASNNGCADPIVLTVAGVTCVELFESRARLEKAVAAFAHSHYKAYPRMFATESLAGALKGQAARVKSLDIEALDLFKESLHDGSLQAADQEELAFVFTDNWGAGLFERHPEKVISITEQAGPDFRWLACLLRGFVEVKHAWKARGDGWANSVSAAGWQGFHDHLANANIILTEAWKLHPEWPQAAAEMVTVIMAESDADQARDWFDRATVAQIDDPAAWNNMRWALRPRWEGSLEALRAFGASAINSERFDTDVPRKFFDCVTDIETDSKNLPGQHIYGREDIWPEMKRMYEGYIAAPSQERYAAGWRGSYAIVAYFANHFDVAREQLEKLDWQLPPAKLEGWGTDLSLVTLEVAARTGSQAREITEAEHARDDDRIDEALKLYQKLASSARDERTKQFIQHRVASLAIEQRLQKGDWIDFLPSSTNDLNWISARGRWNVLPDGAVEIESGPTGSMLFSGVRVGTEFEVKGEFEAVRSTTGDFQAGLVMGLPESSQSDWYAFLVKRNRNEGQIAAYARAWSLRGSVRLPAAVHDGRNSFLFRLRDGKADASVNDAEVIHNADNPGSIRVCDNQFLLGLGAYNDMNETVIRYSNVKVRRLGGTGSSSGR